MLKGLIGFRYASKSFLCYVFIQINYWQMAESGLIRVVDDVHMLLSNASKIFQKSGALICFTIIISKVLSTKFFLNISIESQ